MAEYAGYVASTPVNYGEITKDLVNNFIAIDQAKREEDRKTQAELDKNYSNDLDKINEFQLSSNPTFNDAVGVMADGTKTALYNAYKTGNMKEVNRVKANLRTSINNINAASKAIDTNYNEIKELVGKNQVSKIGTVYAELYQDAVDFSNGAFAVMPDGKIPYVKYDENGKIISKSSFYDPATLASTRPFIDPNLDYDKELNDWMKNVGSFKDEQGNVTIVSPLKNPAFSKAKETKIADLTSTDRNSARFLSSVGGYVGYRNEAQKQKLLEGKNITEDKLIKVELVDGIPQPMLSDAQRKAAKALAEEQIDQRVSFTKTLDEPRPVRISVGREDKLTQGEEDINALGESADEIIADIKLRGSNTKFTRDILNGVAEKIGGPEYMPAGAKLKSNKFGGIDVVDAKGGKIATMNTPEEVIQILGNKSILDSRKIYKRYQSVSGDKVPTSKEKAKAKPGKYD